MQKVKLGSTIYRDGNRRFFFFAREELRMHVHISSPDGEVKFWLEPTVALADYAGFSGKDLNNLQRVVEGHADEFRYRWQQYFGS